MSAFTDFLALELASLKKLVKTPTSLGYGLDLSCVSDIKEACTEVDPMSRDAITEAILRRLQTPNGSLALFGDTADYGLDLVSLLNVGVETKDLNSLGQRIQTEVRKDDRVAQVKVTATYAFATSTLDIQMRITPRGTSQAFSLTFAVTSKELLINEVK